MTAPLTPDDQRAAVRAAYRPWEAACALNPSLRDGHGLADTRPVHHGSGHRYMLVNGSTAGIEVNIFGPEPRAGLITWTAAERIIRQVATRTTTDALIAAVTAHQAAWEDHIARPQTNTRHEQIGRLGDTARAAWLAL